jgi:hypothetical protein
MPAVETRLLELAAEEEVQKRNTFGLVVAKLSLRQDNLDLV